MAKRKGFGGMPGFGGFGGGNLNGLLQQAQKMQKDMAEAQEKIASLEVTATAGGGMVQVQMNGDHKLLSVSIKPEAVDPEDVEMLQDLIVSAVNEAERLLAEQSAAMMPQMPQMPGLPGGLF